MLSSILFFVAIGSQDPRQLLDAGRYAEAERLLRASLTQSAGGERAAALNLLAIALHRQGRYEDAAIPLAEALDIAKGRKPFELVNLYANIGANRFERGLFPETQEALRQGYAHAARLEPLEDADTAQALNNLGMLAMGCKHHQQADTLLRRSLDMHIRLFGVGHWKTALVQENLGRLYMARGQFHEAESLWTRVLATREAALGSQHPDVARVLISLSGIRIRRNDGANAERLAWRAMQIAQQDDASGQLQAASLAAHANALRIQKRFAEAEAEYEKALPMLERQHGANHPNVAVLLMNLAGAKAALRKDAESSALVLRSRNIRGLHKTNP